MAFCPNCGAEIEDGKQFCGNCGASLNGTPTMNTTAFNPYDHTAEFSPEDISQNKVIAMSCYLLGVIGILFAFIAAKDSPYAAFHARQSLKFRLVTVLVAICTAFFWWTVIVPIVAAIFKVVLYVIEIICFFDVCNGKAKEAAIIRSLNFLK